MATERDRAADQRQVLTSSEQRVGGIESREEVRRIGQQPGEPRPASPGTPDAPPSVEHRERYVRDAATERRLLVDKLNQFVWLVFGAIECLIGLRILLKLMAANPSSPFAHYVYALAGLFLWPFTGLTVSPAAGGAVLEIPGIIAMIVYALLGWLVMRLLRVLFEQTTARSTSTFDRYDS